MNEIEINNRKAKLSRMREKALKIHISKTVCLTSYIFKYFLLLYFLYIIYIYYYSTLLVDAKKKKTLPVAR